MDRKFTIKAEVELKGEPPDVQRAQAAIIETINSPMWHQQLESRLRETGELENEVEIRRVTAHEGSIEVIIAAAVTVYGIMGFFATLEDTIAFVERVSQSQIADTVKQNIQHYGGRVNGEFQKVASEIKDVRPRVMLILSLTLLLIVCAGIVMGGGFIVALFTPESTLTVNCDWEDDWTLQSDGTYLWTGSPPGSSYCPRVGQDGELLTRMQNGERMTLIVDVGRPPLPLAICLFDGAEITGNFRPGANIGDVCYDNNTATEQQFPHVSGLVEITGSTGFVIGYQP